jgi:ubiquinone/menaquinone biosynthesis C-methylase UbiE
MPNQPFISGEETPRLYADLADWWPLLSAPQEYQEEAGFIHSLFRSNLTGIRGTLLELGSGGGNNASFLKHNFDCVLVDRSPGMLAVSQKLNPECEHVPGDMRTVRLNKQFDCVLIHDAIMYMLDESDLREAIRTAWVHCRPQGTVLLMPDFVLENFQPETSHGGHDGDGRALRYLEWSFDPDVTDTTFETYFVYMLRDINYSVQVIQDRHTVGLFSRGVWSGLLSSIGFSVQTIIDPYGREVFLCKKPGV